MSPPATPALLGRWSSCRRCGSKAFAARAPRGAVLWVCTNTATCAAQYPVGLDEYRARQAPRFAPAIDLAASAGAQPSSWGLLERGPGTP